MAVNEAQERRITLFLRLDFLWASAEAVQPVGLLVIDQIDDGADAPGDGIGPEEKHDIVADLHGHRNVDDTQDAPD